jgi:hypothetical protein
MALPRWRHGDVEQVHLLDPAHGDVIAPQRPVGRRTQQPGRMAHRQRVDEIAARPGKGIGLLLDGRTSSRSDTVIGTRRGAVSRFTARPCLSASRSAVVRATLSRR